MSLSEPGLTITSEAVAPGRLMLLRSAPAPGVALGTTLRVIFLYSSSQAGNQRNRLKIRLAPSPLHHLLPLGSGSLSRPGSALSSSSSTPWNSSPSLSIISAKLPVHRLPSDSLDACRCCPFRRAPSNVRRPAPTVVYQSLTALAPML